MLKATTPAAVSASAVGSKEQTQWKVLESVAGQLSSGEKRIVISGSVQVTKPQGLAESRIILLRRTDLEKRVREVINQMIPGGIAAITDRYGSRYDEALSREFPRHYPVSLLGGQGHAANGQNIFMFFPWASGVISVAEEHQFGLEFINAWTQAFHEIIFPCMQTLFDEPSQVAVQEMLENLEVVIYMASVLHEIGHRVGPFRVSPLKKESMRLQDDLIFGACGELTTDSLMAALVPELPEVALSTFLYRLFLYPRRGFAESGNGDNINQDNDALLGPVLWQIARRQAAIAPAGNRYHLDVTRLQAVFTEALDAVDGLGNKMLGKSASESQDLGTTWMKTMTGTPPNSQRYVMAAELALAYSSMLDVPEYYFHAPVSLATDLTERDLAA